MATALAVVDYSKSLVGQKVKVKTNPYGGQCVALIDHIVQHFTEGEMNLAYTNAKDCLAKAENEGMEVIYNNPNDPDLIPQEGDFVVLHFGPSDPFGHILVCVSADRNGMVTVEQNIDGYSDHNQNGINDQLEIDGGGYTRNYSRNYEGVIGWFRLPYDSLNQKKEEEENDMITISAPGRGIALMMGGKFLPILHKDTPLTFWNQGVKHYSLDTATFDAWQGKAEKSTLDDTTVNKLIAGLKK
ncbi:CHAP domain-containing protein [Streptococcus minor]|uniref:CHAP domain-containing protein n=1 Tax=Streptococcus minor TaxID=229549 RepID=UPI00035E3FFE|nr:CHAP domain-containing protein [Streptococcus minor]